MAGGGFAPAHSTALHGGATTTAAALLTCLIAASGGLIFGYDMGISGGVTTMEPFLKKFFPGVRRLGEAARPDKYCVYNSQILTGFTSSLYLAALLSSLIAARLTATAGRRAVMIAAGALYLAGAALNAVAENLVMLIAGRLLLGLGVGFANQATPIYIAEMSPSSWRGASMAAFQFSIGFGSLAANLVNYFAAKLNGDMGWRLALGLAGVPAAISDSPASLSSSRESLLLTRGSGGGGGGGAVFRRKYRGYLVVGVMIMIFQPMTGINLVAFYAPVLFQAVGFGGGAALLAAAFLTAVNLGALVASSFIVDRYGRKVLFVLGGGQMLICQAAIGGMLAATVGGDGAAQLPPAGAMAILIILCVYTASYGCSWGPLSWLVPAEIFPADVRPAGMSAAMAVNLSIAVIQAQAMLAALCWTKFGLFFLFAGCLAVMTAFVVGFLPETKEVPLEAMESVWASHWFWRHFVEFDDLRLEKEASQSPISSALLPGHISHHHL